MPGVADSAPSAVRTIAAMPTGKGSPSRWRNCGLAFSNCNGTPVHAEAAADALGSRRQMLTQNKG